MKDQEIKLSDLCFHGAEPNFIGANRRRIDSKVPIQSDRGELTDSIIPDFVQDLIIFGTPTKPIT